MKFIEKFTSSKKLRHGQLEKIIFEYKDEAFPQLKKRNRLELIQGLISDTIVTKLRRYVSRKMSNEIAVRIIQHFHNAFKKHVWIPRCTELNTCEANLGISKKDKMITVRRHPFSDITQQNSQHVSVAHEKKESYEK